MNHRTMINRIYQKREEVIKALLREGWYRTVEDPVFKHPRRPFFRFRLLEETVLYELRWENDWVELWQQPTLEVKMNQDGIGVSDPRG